VKDSKVDLCSAVVTRIFVAATPSSIFHQARKRTSDNRDLRLDPSCPPFRGKFMADMTDSNDCRESKLLKTDDFGRVRTSTTQPPHTGISPHLHHLLITYFFDCVSRGKSVSFILCPALHQENQKAGNRLRLIALVGEKACHSFYVRLCIRKIKRLGTAFD